MKKLKILCTLIIIPIFLLCTTSGTFINNASSHIVIERSSLRVLEGDNIHTQMLVASTAKILTAITAIENYDLEEEVIITKEDVNEVGSKVYLKENEKIKRIDLLYALMLRSANDAASALSQNNSQKFILLMNETAKKIGMRNSVFENASGLDEREYNLSTAYDMAILSAYASNNETFKKISSTHTYSCNSDTTKYSWVNKHKLVKNDELFVWGKTGYTKKSKRILVSNYVKDNMDVIVVTINRSDDWNYHRLLVNSLHGYDFIPIYKKGIYDTKMDVSYYIYIKNDIYLPLKKNEYDSISLKFRLYQNKAILDVYYKNNIICNYDITVYDKKSIDLDLLIETFNSNI